MGDMADDLRDRQDRENLDRLLNAVADELPANPWNDLPAADPVQDEIAWQQRDVPPELRALGVEKDVLGTVLQVVQVRMAGAPRNYTYQWWSLTMVDDGWRTGADWLRTGDWVRLPGNVVSPEGAKGRVEGYGRNGYSGPLKDVSCRIEPQDPWTVRMEAVRGAGDALRVYRAAESKGVPPERLEALAAVGKAALEKLEAGRL